MKRPGGTFSGPVQSELLDDGRNMRILAEVTYTDRYGVEWTSIAGDLWNGSSIPPAIWGRWQGSPFVGLHRKASVFHDAACGLEDRPWAEVHRMFYECMLDCGVDPIEAAQKHWAVWKFGPRWEPEEQTVQVFYSEFTDKDISEPDWSLA